MRTRADRLILWIKILFGAEIAIILRSFLQVLTGYTPNSLDLSALDFLIIITGFGYFFAYVMAAIFYCKWMYRAVSNIFAASVTPPKHSPTASVAWNFVPIANLFIPYKIMCQVWNLSRRDAHIIDEGDPILTQWWGTWIIGGILQNIASQILWHTEDPALYSMASRLIIASGIILLFSYPALIRIVIRITEDQATELEYNPPA